LELQYHPASGRRTVSVFSMGPRGERFVILLTALAALLAVSLWWTAPSLLARSRRRAQAPATASALAAARATDLKARRDAASLAARLRDWGDDLARIAFLYDVSPARWPRALDPARGLLAAGDSEGLAAGLPVYLRGLERARTLVAEREAEEPELAARTPSIAPIREAAYEPAVFFGPRVSPWTGQEEFFAGLDLAAPEGSPVVAPADGRVVFTGRPRRESAARLWQFGSLVVVAHGPDTATLFGHLARAEVRRGDRVRRGQRLGSVGKSGWALSPRLHYELWRRREAGWGPTDPLFAILDRRLGERRRSLEQMLASSAPGPGEVLPGVR
jgi:murein DD-endopeptidase MepM/ murein hydrolase activator NlpD